MLYNHEASICYYILRLEPPLYLKFLFRPMDSRMMRSNAINAIQKYIQEPGL